MGVQSKPDGVRPREAWFIEKMKSAYVIKECLEHLQQQASDEHFPFSASLIASAAAALDDELRQITQVEFSSAAGSQASRSN